MPRPRAIVQSVSLALLLLSGPHHARADEGAKRLESDRQVEAMIAGLRAEIKRIPDVDPATADKFLRATERLGRRIAATAVAVQAAATTFDESDALEFATLAKNPNKLAALNRWQKVTDEYQGAAVKGSAEISNLAGVFRTELEREKLPEKQVSTLVAGFLKAEKMDEARRAYALQAKVATGAHRFVGLLIEHERVWSVDPESDQVESDDAVFAEKFDVALTDLQNDMEAFNKLLESIK